MTAITLNPPVIVGTNPTKTYSSLTYTVSYNDTNQTCVGIINENGQSVIIFGPNTNPTYEAAGQWTDDDTNAQLLMLIQSNQLVLQ